MSVQRRGKIIQYFIPLSGGSVSGLKGQLIFCTGQGFFLSLFLCGAGFLFRWLRAVISLPICDLRVVVLAQWLRWLDSDDVEQCLGEGTAFA